MPPQPPTLPVTLQVPEGVDARSCVVLVDGEHYPTAVADAITTLRQAGWDVRAAALVGGGEKLREEPDYGVPHLTGDSPADALRAALAAAGAEAGSPVSSVLDL